MLKLGEITSFDILIASKTFFSTELDSLNHERIERPVFPRANISQFQHLLSKVNFPRDKGRPFILFKPLL